MRGEIPVEEHPGIGLKEDNGGDTQEDDAKQRKWKAEFLSH